MPKTTPATEWAPKTYTRVLPSGKVARLRPVGSDFFAQLGRVPNSILPDVMALFDGTPGPSLDFKTDSPDKIVDLIEFMNIVCESVFFEPMVVSHDHPNRAAGEISVRDIDIADKVDVLEFFKEPAERLVPFRPEQDGDVGAVDDGEGGAVQTE